MCEEIHEIHESCCRLVVPALHASRTCQKSLMRLPRLPRILRLFASERILFAVEADCWNMLKSHWQSIMCPMSTMSRITALESLDCFQSWNILKLWSVLNKFEYVVSWLLLALSRSIWRLSFDYRWTSGVSERLRAQSSSSFCAPKPGNEKSIGSVGHPAFASAVRFYCTNSFQRLSQRIQRLPMGKDVKEVSDCMSPEHSWTWASCRHVSCYCRRLRNWLTLAASASQAAGTFRGAPKFLNSNQAGPLNSFPLDSLFWFSLTLLACR